MNEQASLDSEQTTNSSRWWWLLAGLALVLLIWLVVWLSGSRPLKFWQDTAVSPNATLNPQPLLVNFDALNNNPAEFANQRIRVTGNYLRLEPPDCTLFSGPRIQWGLVAEGLQLNAQGFETIVLPIVPPNMQMTVEGIWRRYAGPAGCGKEPDRGLWYLEVTQIVAPNPLVAGTATPVGVLSVTPPPFPTVTPTGTASLPPVGGTPIPNVTIVSTVVVNTPTSTPTLDETAVFGTPTFTPTNTATATVTATPGPGTPTAVSGTPTATPTPTTSGTPGSGPTNPTPTNSSLVTATPGSGYPGPTSPAPTPSPAPYPGG
ncbi:MAG: hypothetical protein IPJ90_01065 [Anaerolineaceae bacterium]|nr:hypothetical protein [Anaerolineaceae bacterium]